MNGASPPGSLSEGAAERSEAEGVYFVARNKLKISEFICAGVQTIGPEEPSNDTPSVSPSGCQLPQRGSREGLHHSPGCSLISNVTGDFHRPYKTQKSFPFTIQRSTLPQRGSREMFPFNRVLAKILRFGRFSSPLRKAFAFIAPKCRPFTLRHSQCNQSHTKSHL